MTRIAKPQRYRWRLASSVSDIPPHTPGDVRRDAHNIGCSSRRCFSIAKWIIALDRKTKTRRYGCDACASRFPIIPGDTEIRIVDVDAKPPRRLMVAAERRMAIALAKVTMIPGIPSKAFARDMAAIAGGDDPQITENQAAALRSLIVRYRRQIPHAVVALAGAIAQHAAPLAEVPA